MDEVSRPGVDHIATVRTRLKADLPSLHVDIGVVVPVVVPARGSLWRGTHLTNPYALVRHGLLSNHPACGIRLCN
jgi:hypothetical protein